MERSASDSDAISASAATPADFAVVFDRHFDAVHAYRGAGSTRSSTPSAAYLESKVVAAKG